MNLKEAKLLFQTGALQEPLIQRQQDGWTVRLAGNHPLNPALDTARGQVRVFKTADAAIETLFGLGFQRVGVVRYK